MSLDHLRQRITAAHCTRCGRTGHLSTLPDGLWCGWCGGPASAELRTMDVLGFEAAQAHEVDGVLIDPERVPLQPLRITAGWTMHYNNGLHELDPTPGTIPWWWIFKEDMLVLVHRERNRLLDLGWTPEMDVENGAYRLTLYEEGYGGRVIREFDTRDRPALVAEIESILDAVTCGRL